MFNIIAAESIAFHTPIKILACTASKDTHVKLKYKRPGRIQVPEYMSRNIW